MKNSGLIFFYITVLDFIQFSLHAYSYKAKNYCSYNVDKCSQSGVCNNAHITFVFTFTRNM